jgi:predicted nucleic acid-binding protein
MIIKPRIYLDVNFLIHVLQGETGPFGLDAQKAFRNLARGYAGTHMSVCVSNWQLSVLENALSYLGLRYMYESFLDAYIEVVDATGGIEDTVRVTEEDYVALCKEAVATGAAPDGEDLGHLKAMLRLGVSTFITDDHDFAVAAQKAGLEVVKSNAFVRLANRGQFYARPQAIAC